MVINIITGLTSFLYTRKICLDKGLTSFLYTRKICLDKKAEKAMKDHGCGSIPRPQRPAFCIFMQLFIVDLSFEKSSLNELCTFADLKFSENFSLKNL